MTGIFDNQAQQSIQLMPGIMPLRGFIAPEPQNYSSITNSFSSIGGYSNLYGTDTREFRT